MIDPGDKRPNLMSEEEEEFLNDEEYIKLMVDVFSEADDYTELTDEDKILQEFGYQSTMWTFLLLYR